MSVTIKQRLQAALERKGFKVASETRRYTVMTTGKVGTFYYLGDNGALRYGRSATASVSLSMPPTAFYAALLVPQVPVMVNAETLLT